MKRRIIIVGKGGSGKDYLRTILEKKLGLSYSVSYTSRPKRIGEINGEDYWFVERSYFKENSDLFYEMVEFNNWFYGTSIVEFKKSSVLIMTPYGISKIKPEDRDESFIVYLDIPVGIRRSRLSERKDEDDTERRIIADDIDFEDFEDFDFIITNSAFGDTEINLLAEASGIKNKQYDKHSN